MEQRVRTRVVAHGRVQGVWFRDSTRRMALGECVSGWVRNLPDGGVEAVFEGESVAVTRAVEWTRRGPERASVVSLVEHPETPEGLLGFEIRG